LAHPRQINTLPKELLRTLLLQQGTVSASTTFVHLIPWEKSIVEGMDIDRLRRWRQETESSKWTSSLVTFWSFVLESVKMNLMKAKKTQKWSIRQSISITSTTGFRRWTRYVLLPKRFRPNPCRISSFLCKRKTEWIQNTAALSVSDLFCTSGNGVPEKVNVPSWWNVVLMMWNVLTRENY